MSVMVSRGYGKHSWDVTLPDIVAVQPLALARATFVVTAAVWSKTSFAITVYRLSSKNIKRVLIFIVVSMNVAMGLGCVFSWASCSPIRKAWNPAVDGTCWPIKTLNNYSIFAACKYSRCPLGALRFDDPLTNGTSILWHHGHCARYHSLDAALGHTDALPRKDWCPDSHEHGHSVSSFVTRRLRLPATY